MKIEDIEYNDKLIDYLQQAQITLNKILMDKQGEVFSWSDFEKFYISISYSIKDDKGYIYVNAEDKDLRSLIWKILMKTVKILNNKIDKEALSINETPKTITFDKLEFDVVLNDLISYNKSNK